jgi:mono/diheme cytochrome c family protein
MLKPFLLLSAVILLAVTLPPWTTLASGSPAQITPASPPSTNPVRPTAASQERAKKLFAIDCAVCHGDNGNGATDLAKSMNTTLLDWTDPKSLADKSDQDLFTIIRNGKDKMPAEDASRAKDSEVWNLIIYIRGFSKGQRAETTTPSN